MCSIKCCVLSRSRWDEIKGRSCHQSSVKSRPSRYQPHYLSFGFSPSSTLPTWLPLTCLCAPSTLRNKIQTRHCYHSWLPTSSRRCRFPIPVLLVSMVDIRLSSFRPILLFSRQELQVFQRPVLFSARSPPASSRPSLFSTTVT